VNSKTDGHDYNGDKRQFRFVFSLSLSATPHCEVSSPFSFFSFLFSLPNMRRLIAGKHGISDGLGLIPFRSMAKSYRYRFFFLPSPFPSRTADHLPPPFKPSKGRDVWKCGSVSPPPFSIFLLFLFSPRSVDDMGQLGENTRHLPSSLKWFWSLLEVDKREGLSLPFSSMVGETRRTRRCERPRHPSHGVTLHSPPWPE